MSAMKNLLLVTSREYLTRVKKRSFIIMTLLTPLLIASFYGVIIWVSVSQDNNVSKLDIVVVDEAKVFEGKLPVNDKVNFIFEDSYEKDSLFQPEAVDGIIRVPKSYTITDTLNLVYESTSSLSVNENSRITSVFRNYIRKEKLKNIGISQESIDSLRSSVNLTEFKVKEDGSTESSNIGVNTALGMALAIMIYFFIFMYGVQVMRGVIEEKTNRIVEIIISTLKPFQLMMGKVIGIALVGLTQLGIWILLSGILTVVIGLFIGFNALDSSQVQDMASNPAMQNMNQNALGFVQSFLDLNLAKIFTSFVFYFLGGYLFYGALFAAIGSAVDSETDTQQFMLPVTLPLVFSFAVSFSVVISDPNGVLATWLSIIPISSPIVMMARLPFDPPAWQVLTSIGVLILSILGVIWLAAKIYKTGILMYGKKPTYKEIAKWLFYKN
jgi:ABC-2 type transport system permease protein